MTRPLARFHALSSQRKRLLCEAFIRLAYVRALLVFLPIRRMLPYTSGEPAGGAVQPDEHDLRRDIHWAVVVASRLLPRRTDCLPRSIVQSRMQRRRRLSGVLYIGVRRDAGAEFRAHAWVAGGPDAETMAQQAGWRIIARYPICPPLG